VGRDRYGQTDVSRRYQEQTLPRIALRDWACAKDRAGHESRGWLQELPREQLRRGALAVCVKRAAVYRDRNIPVGFWKVCYMRATPIQRHCHVNAAYMRDSKFKIWSGARDLNPGPHGPEPG